MTIQSRSKWEFILIAIVVMAGCAARLYEASYNFDGDEISSVKLASMDFRDVVSGSLQDRPHPPLHNVLLHFWIRAFGKSELSARTLSILFSGIFLVVTYHLLRRFISTWLALGLLSIFAISPLFVYFGQQARPYALIACVSSINLLAFVKLLEAPASRWRLSAWSITCALLLYSQYFGFFSIVVQIALLLFCLRTGRLAILLYGVAGIVLILPWLIASFGSSVHSGGDPLAHISWMKVPLPTDLAWFYVSPFGECPWLRMRWLMLILAFLGVSFLKQLFVSRKLSVAKLVLVIISFGMPLAVYAISNWGPKPIFAERQMIGAAIAFVIVIGLCLEALPKTLGYAVLLILMTWTATGLPQSFPSNKKPPWRDIAAYIDEHYGSMVVVAGEGWVSDPLVYYRKSGPVRLCSDFREVEISERVLYVCRASESTRLNEFESLTSHNVLLPSKRWGGESESKELYLYEIGIAERH